LAALGHAALGFRTYSMHELSGLAWRRLSGLHLGRLLGSRLSDDD
jgi:hypothetical protein